MVVNDGLSVFTGFNVGGLGPCSPGKNCILRTSEALF